MSRRSVAAWTTLLLLLAVLCCLRRCVVPVLTVLGVCVNKGRPTLLLLNLLNLLRQSFGGGGCIVGVFQVAYHDHAESFGDGCRRD